MSTTPNIPVTSAVPEIVASSALINVEPSTDGTMLSAEELAEALAQPSETPSQDEHEPEFDFGTELADYVDQIPAPTNNTASAISGSGQNEQLCTNAKRAILHYHGTSIISEYLQGKYLFVLQSERAKPGTGTFVADLAELRKVGAIMLSTATAYRRISNYEAVSEGLADLLPRRLSQVDKDKWGGVEDLTLQDFEEALERKAGDTFTAQYQAMIAEQKRLLAKLKREQGGSTTMNIQLFGLSKEQKDQFHAAFDSLVQAKGNDKVAASKCLVDMVCLFANTGKVVAA